MDNPFEYGRELGADELVNRSAELATVQKTISTGGKLFIIGPRRFGKTSLLKAATERSERKGQIVLRYNAESFPDITNLVERIVEDTGKSLKGKIEKTGEELRRYFKSLRPEISFSVTQNEWKASLGVLPSAASGHVGLLVDALNGLEKLASELAPRRRTALIIDEFQDILVEGGIAAERQLRAAIQTHKHTAYIFAGSKTSMLTEVATDPARPFYRLGELLFVGELPRPEFVRFLLDKFILGDFLPLIGMEDEKRLAAGTILDLAEDVPYNVQMLAHTLWDRLAQIKITAPEKAILTVPLITETLETIVRRNDPFYTQVWNGMTAIQKKALRAVVDENGQQLQSMRVVKTTGVSPSSMRRALESLVARDVLRQEESEGTVRFRFEDPFFSHWARLFTYHHA